MRVIVDILTPKQCMFFSRLVEHLSKRGHEVHCVTRRYREVNELLEMLRIEAKVVGEHGGIELSSKLESSATRIIKLLEVYRSVSPDVSVSFSSPETARVSFGLRIPHISVNDSPHAEAVARLTIPISSKLLTPFVIPKRAWTVYGIPAERILHYKALDPWMWLKDFKPDCKILERLGLEESRPVVTFRVEESFASYLLEKSPQKSLITFTIEKLLERRGDLQVVVLPRYREQITELAEALRGKALVCSRVVDGPSLLSSSAIFIGGGGTMNAESSMLGVPTLSFYPGEATIVERFLIRKKLIKRENNPEQLWRRVSRMLDRIDEVKMGQKERARELVEDFEDPLEKITEAIESYER